jgi:putative ABC transport system ATP-binding protein
MTPPEGTPGAILGLSGLTKTYAKGGLPIRALEDVSFEVKEGQFVSIVGRSGSGKSTLLNLIGGLDTATAGDVVFRGRDLTRMKRSDLARHRRESVGMVFQSFNLIAHRSAASNVELAMAFGGVPRSERRDRARRLLERVGLGERLDHKPGELSGGEAQRVAIARALANGPEMLLLDEPTGNLDTSTAAEIMELVQQLNQERGITVLMVTHETDIAEVVSDLIIRLQDGRVVGQSSGGGTA